MSLFFRLIRIGFLPLLLLASGSMVIGARSFGAGRPINLVTFEVIASNILWMLYGSLLNDVCDRNSDRHNVAARKVLTEHAWDSAYLRLTILLGFALPTAIDSHVFFQLQATDPLMATQVFLPVTISGVFLGTAYSAPPLRARSYLLGATWTLMAYYPFCFLRTLAVAVESNDLLPFSYSVYATIAFLWSCHGITTVAMKDIPDAFADRLDCIRSIPNTLGPYASFIVSIIFICLTVIISSISFCFGILSGWFLLPLFVAGLLYMWLAFYLSSWLERAFRDSSVAEHTPRFLFHAVAYVGTWGILIPAYMVCLKP